MNKIQAVLVSSKISSNSKEAYNLCSTQNFGEKDKEIVTYTLAEALYLVGEGKMDVFDSAYKKISKEKLIKKLQKIDKEILLKYIVYKDLRKKGYIVKSALKFGAPFRIYENMKKDNHAKWLCFPISENKSLKWQDFASKNRVAHSTQKKVLIAIVDEENSVSYYETSWLKI